MTLNDKNIFLLEIQGQLGIYGGRLSDALNIGKCSDKLIHNSILANILFDILRRFNINEGCITETQFCNIRNKILTLIK